MSGVNRAAIVLAGGEGKRLSAYTRKITGSNIPKQFCALIGNVSLLEQTRRRASRSVPPGRILLTLNRNHERFFSPLLAQVPLRNLVVQPRNRGTAAAIAYSLLRLEELAPRASVLLMPSDHHVGDDAALMKHVDLAFEAVELRPELTVLLGITPDHAETAYGWIEPGPALGGSLKHIRRVLRFWEKPSSHVACELMARGCLWNSFMLVGRVSALLSLILGTLPDLYFSFSALRPSLGTALEEETVRRLYDSLPQSDFSHDVLETAAVNLTVLPIRDIGWSDLGEPARIAKVLASLRTGNPRAQGALGRAPQGL